MNRLLNTTGALATAALLALSACGGASQSSATGPAKDAPPPPGPGTDKTADRQVSKKATADFSGAVKFFQQQAQTGWTDAKCTAAAKRFIDVGNSHKNLVEAWFNAGVSYQACNDFKNAEKYYQDALRIKSNHGGSLANLGEIYFKGGNEARAKQYWEKALKADLKTTSAHNNLAWLTIREMRKTTDRSRLKDLEAKAKGHLSRALATENDNVEAYTLYALLYQQGYKRNKSRLDLAKLLLDEGDEQNPKYPALHNARGLLLLKRDNVSQALRSFETAVRLDPKFAEARMNVGNVVLGFRKYGEAKKQFEAVLKLQPKNYDAVIGLGIAQRGLKDFDGAEATYKRARKLNGKRGDALFNLGILYYTFRANASEDLPKSVAAYKQARTYFNQFLGKSGNKPADVKEAKSTVKGCDKIIKELEEVIRQMKAQKK